MKKKKTLKWTKKKPIEPGEYFTRHARDGSNLNKVQVTRVGRGLSVYCAAYGDRVPMSAIGNDELEWAEAYYTIRGMRLPFPIPC